MKSASAKIFIISLDGATFNIIRPLAEQGYMPNLQAAMAGSVSAELESVVPPVTAPAWTSFMTGKHPNKHGIFDFTSFDCHTYKWSINNASNIKGKTLWKILGEHEKRVVVLNLPYTYPPSEVNGIVVAGWDAPHTAESFSYPPEIGSEIIRRFPDYKDNLWISELQPLYNEEHFKTLITKLKAGFAQQAAIASDLLTRELWDVFMVHFQQTDWIQHKLWTHIAQACSEPSNHGKNVEAARECYRQFDRHVGSLMKQAASSDVTTVILSDHGFCRLRGNIKANSYLHQWEYLSIKPRKADLFQPVKNLLRNSRFHAAQTLYGSLKNIRDRSASINSRHNHKSWTDNAGDVVTTRGSDWDWAKTKVAAIYAYQMGFLYVNLIGRNPQGIVQPGNEYDALLDELISRFRAITHPDTDTPLLKDVIRGIDIYPVATNDIPVPDLVLVPFDGFGFSFSLGETRPTVSKEGTHQHNGIVIINGALINSAGTIVQPGLIDLAPTMLHLLGLPVPSDMDGRVWEEVIASARPVHYCDPSPDDSSHANENAGYSDLESDVLGQRLKGLGYLE